MARSLGLLVVVVLCSTASLLPASFLVVGEAQVNADMQAHMAARTAAWAGLTNFSFGVYSDIHMVEDQTWGLMRPQWQRLIQRWRDSGDLFGLIIGDLGYGQPSHIQNVLSGPAAVSGAPPIFYAMGNHELDGGGKRAWIDALYPGAVQPGSWTFNSRYSPGNGDHVYFSFNVGPSTHFIVLDGNYMTFDGVDARARQSFGQTQLAWLAADIAANANRNILIFVHEPIDQQVNGSTPFYMLNDRGSIMDLLAAHPRQKYVFSGHFHTHQGTTLWRGVKSVHVMWGTDPNYGVRVVVNGDQITVVSTGATTNFDAHPMNQIENVGGTQTIKVREDGTHAGHTRNLQMLEAGPENGVAPTSGIMMLKATNVNWYNPRFISEQLIKIQPGMRFSYDIYLHDVINGKDAVTVQPDWYMRDGRMPPRIVDQNGIQLSRRSKDGLFFLFNEDVPSLGARATGRWYHREFDLAQAVGEYVDGLYLTTGSGFADVGTVYVDNIRFTTGNIAPVVSLTAPADLSTYQSPASIPVSATASDPDGSIARVDFFASGALIGSDSTAPYAMTWTGAAIGTYNVTAVAVDNLGSSTTSNVARVSVVSSNLPPTVSIVSPPPGSTFQSPATITITALANDADGSVTRVDFRANGNPIGSRTTAPFTIVWPGVAAGTYALTAVATDNQGAVTTSLPVTITVMAAQGRQTVLTSQVPTMSITSSADLELGLRVVSNTPGQITAVRFWKVAGETGTHVGRIWLGIQQVASVTFSGETASGWQEQALTSPLPVSAGVEHVVSVNTTNFKFAATIGGIAGGIVSGNLRAPTDMNGVYGAPGSRPLSHYADTNYFRDVVFFPSALPLPAEASLDPAQWLPKGPVALMVAAPPVELIWIGFVLTVAIWARGRRHHGLRDA
jgi:hypothetical protein